MAELEIGRTTDGKPFTCLVFGTSPVTAYQVAAIFIEGVEKLYAKNSRL